MSDTQFINIDPAHGGRLCAPDLVPVTSLAMLMCSTILPCSGSLLLGALR